MTKILLGAALAAIAFSVPAAAPAQRGGAAPAILIVDTDRILSTCTACVAANTQMQSLVTSANTRAQQLRTPIETDARSLDQQAASVQAMPAGAARTQQEAALRVRGQQLETRQNQANQELQRLEANLQSTRANITRQLGERVVQIANQIMTQRGAVAVFSKGSTLASSDTIEITNDVLAALNQQLPAVSVTPLPQQATQGR